MSNGRKASFQVIYAGKDITHDITGSVISLTYTDKVAAHSDTIELHIEDTDGRWANEWYPTKKDRISVKMGYPDGMMDCGTFEVDEIELSGPPDIIMLRGLATTVSSSVRTKVSTAHEGKTLRQIADDIAKSHGFTVNDGTKTAINPTVDLAKEIHDTKIYSQFAMNAANAGTYSIRLATFQALLPQYRATVFSLNAKGFNDIAQVIAVGFQNALSDITYVGMVHLSGILNQAIASMIEASVPAVPKITEGVLAGIRIGRATQNRETDLGFLKRISAAYGIIFSLKGTQMVFMSMYALEAAKPIKVLDKSDLTSFSLKDKLVGTYNAANVSYRNPGSGKLIKSTYKVQKEVNEDGYAVDVIVKDDVLNVRGKAENQTQADAMAKAALHNANTHQCEGGLAFPGDILCVSGVNIQLTGAGELSGNFHIDECTHRLDKSGGYITDVHVKRVGYISKVKKKSKKATPIVAKAPPHIKVH